MRKTLLLALTVPLVLAACGTTTASTPSSTSVVVAADGSATYNGVTLSPAQMRQHADALDAAFRDETVPALKTLSAEAKIAAQGLKAQGQIGGAYLAKNVQYNVLTSNSDDCYYVNLAVLSSDQNGANAKATYVSGNSTSVAWWRVRGTGQASVTADNSHYLDLRARCVSASDFFAGTNASSNTSSVRAYDPNSFSAPGLFSALPLYYAAIRTSENDFQSQGYSMTFTSLAASLSAPRSPSAVATIWQRAYAPAPAPTNPTNPRDN